MLTNLSGSSIKGSIETGAIRASSCSFVLLEHKKFAFAALFDGCVNVKLEYQLRRSTNVLFLPFCRCSAEPVGQFSRYCVKSWSRNPKGSLVTSGGVQTDATASLPKTQAGTRMFWSCVFRKMNGRCEECGCLWPWSASETKEGRQDSTFAKIRRQKRAGRTHGRNKEMGSPNTEGYRAG